MTRQRVDTVTGAVTAMQNAMAAPIEPPAHVNLRPHDMPFWESIVKARARDKWDDADLEVAANLARCKSDIERIQRELDAEGDTLVNERGTTVLNPKHTLLETLSRRAVALSRMLHVHPEAKAGRAQDQGNKLKKEREAAETVKQKGNLIAMPSR
jgi:hypothetical protein